MSESSLTSEAPLGGPATPPWSFSALFFSSLNFSPLFRSSPLLFRLPVIRRLVTALGGEDSPGFYYNARGEFFAKRKREGGRERGCARLFRGLRDRVRLAF